MKGDLFASSSCNLLPGNLVVRWPRDALVPYGDTCYRGYGPFMAVEGAACPAFGGRQGLS